jgi:hypothetical protein
VLGFDQVSCVAGIGKEIVLPELPELDPDPDPDKIKKKYKKVNDLTEDARFLLGVDDYGLGIDAEERRDNNINATTMMQYILCLDTLELPYDKEILLNDKDYRLSIIEKLYEKSGKIGKYKNWTVLRYFWENKSEDSQHILKTDEYIKILEDYEKQFEKEMQEREYRELVSKSVPKSVRKSVRKSAVEVEKKEEKITKTNGDPSPAQIIKYLNFIQHRYDEKLIKTNLEHRNGLIEKLNKKRDNEVYNGKSVVEMYEEAVRNNKVNSKNRFGK